VRIKLLLLHRHLLPEVGDWHRLLRGASMHLRILRGRALLRVGLRRWLRPLRHDRQPRPLHHRGCGLRWRSQLFSLHVQRRWRQLSDGVRDQLGMRSEQLLRLVERLSAEEAKRHRLSDGRELSLQLLRGRGLLQHRLFRRL